MKFKYSELSTWLRQQIETGRYRNGDKIPTEIELSKQFAVSRDTVRRAIASLEDENMLYRVKGNGTFVKIDTEQLYTPAKKSDSNLIGVLMNEIDNYIFPDILIGLNKVFEQYGYHTALHITNNKISVERERFLSMINGDYAGYIIEPTRAALPQPNYDLYQRIAETVPTVLIHAKIPSLPLSSVTTSDQAGAYQLTTHLLEQGHRNILFIGKVDEQTGTKRYLGYIDAYQKMGVAIPDDLIFLFCSEDIYGIFKEELPSRLSRGFQSCTAVICQDDQVAYEVKKYLEAREMEKVICGFDDTIIAKVNGFTSVVHPKKEFGELAAVKLLEKIKDPTKDVSYDFEPKLIIRE